MPLIYQKMIFRADLKANPDKLYVFGDNVERRGFGGQAAEMRGEPNAVGIPTKWFPKLTPKAFFWDHQRDEILPILEVDYQTLVDALNQGKTVVWPTDNIGTGLSRLPVYAPKLWVEMEHIRKNVLEKL
jgi:hypothetical protein